ncbi:MAG: hypothetical protein UY15_C0035G0002 [Parcubacteria group bacterium GW2011_GWA2_47_9]|nr:MAG: hypothetical protein UY15_C0035G0002 [Parcubacteria group bacterium GW2011_GWA2_47_9]
MRLNHMIEPHLRSPHSEPGVHHKGRRLGSHAAILKARAYRFVRARFCNLPLVWYYKDKVN